MAPPIWRKHGFEHLRLLVHHDPELREHTEELHGRQQRIDRGVVRAWTCPDVGDADAIVSIQRSEVARAGDRRRDERDEKACEIRSDLEQRIAHVGARAEDCGRIAAGRDTSRTRGGEQLIAPRRRIHGRIASSLARVRELHGCCGSRRK